MPSTYRRIGRTVNQCSYTYLFFLFNLRQTGSADVLVSHGRSPARLALYNIHPARAFMGDTGSRHWRLPFILSGDREGRNFDSALFIIYLAERLSVILQVWYYKRTKRVCSEWHRSISTSVSSTAEREQNRDDFRFCLLVYGFALLVACQIRNVKHWNKIIKEKPPGRCPEHYWLAFTC